MNFNEAFLSFRSKYESTPRVIKIIEDEFGGDDITIIYYDKHDKSFPINITSYEGFRVSSIGALQILSTHEFIYDQYVLNDPNTWEQKDVTGSHHYKSVSKMIANYELSLL